jgi:RNA polymerase sigma-70 factor, ECF subfamily
MQSIEDKEYVIRLKNEDYTAFDALFKKYSESVYAFSVSITKESYIAEDITQLVFIKIWQKRELLDEFLSFKSFLFRITYNEIISWIRKANSEKRRISSFVGSSSFESDETASLVEFNSINSIAEQIIEQLPEKRKEIFKLSREQGLTNREIADKLGISVKTVENQMTAALKLLKEKLGSNEILGLLFFYIMFHQ